MNKIKVALLNPDAIKDMTQMMVTAAKITQHSESIKSLEDLMTLYNSEPSSNLVKKLSSLPHPVLQKYAVINVAVIGASRRFLAQITRHQNEVKFISGSLQYSDYGNDAEFVIPYDILNNEEATKLYLDSCNKQKEIYEVLKAKGIKTDDCGYCMPSGMRNVLLISATPYQWKHMIRQRICRRNSDETRYIMLNIWSQLYKLSEVFRTDDIWPGCATEKCKEGGMSCKKPMAKVSPNQILYADFSKCYE